MLVKKYQKIIFFLVTQFLLLNNMSFTAYATGKLVKEGLRKSWPILSKRAKSSTSKASFYFNKRVSLL